MLTAALPEASDGLESEGDDLVPALVDALDHRPARSQLFVAACLGRVDARDPGKIKDKEVLRRAAAALVRGVKSEDIDARIWTCSLLTTIAAPRAAIPTLRRLVSDADSRVALVASAALAMTNASTQESLTRLRTALCSNEPLGAAVAAVALGRLGLGEPRWLTAIAQALTSSSQPCKYQILAALTGLGAGAHPLVNAVAALAADARNEPYVRGCAMGVLAAIHPSGPTKIEPLRQALISGVPELMNGAIQAFRAWQAFPEDCAGPLAELLSHENCEVRLAAAGALAGIGSHAEPALPALLSRVGRESDPRIWTSVSQALHAIGPSAVNGLIEIVRQGDLTRLAHAGGALALMGTDAALALVEAAELETKDDVKMVLVIVLREAGPMCAPILPALRRFLASTNNEALAQCIVLCLFVLGRAAAPAAPELVRWMLIGDEEISAWSARVLWNIGPDAASALQDTLPLLTPAARQRVESCLARGAPPDAEDFAVLEDIDERLLRLFDAVAGLLTDGDKSYREIERLLVNREDIRGRTAENIAQQVKRLEKLLGGRLTTHKPKKRRGGLEEFGRQSHAKIRRFLRVKDVRRGSAVRGD